MPTQAVMAYANGQNPQVPPYIALGELNRRKQMEQQPAQPAQGSVKDQIEQSLMQPQNLPGLAAQGVPVPQAPQPQGIPAQMPKQLAQSPAPVQMAAGGLASVPVRKDMFNYAPGGIVAFANEENDQVVQEPKYDEDTQSRGQALLESLRDAGAEPAATETKKPTSMSAMANQILMDQMQGKTKVEQPEDPEMTRARMAQKYPILNTLPGAQAEKLALALEEKDKAQAARFKEAEGARGLASLSNALLNAAEATRGQRGMGNQIGSALTGFGKTYNAEQAAAEERASKQEALERGRMVDVSKIRSDVEALQRAQAEGRVSDAMKYKEAINKQIAEVEKTQGAAAAAALKNQIDMATLAETKRHHTSMEDAKPSADDKKLLGVWARINNDDVIGTLSKKLATIDHDSPEGRALIDRIYELKRPYYEQAGLKMQPKAEFPALEQKVEEPNAGLEFLKATGKDIMDLFKGSPKEVTSRPPEVQKALDKYK
jgi:hypothetical protein